ncbi:hypothetical protein DXG01_002472 [Tephrocybe rancida]|nr:hypothetical protein DXG01_002472 [Tephrocybe rancida]
MPSTTRVWLITGTSSGFGLRIAQSALKRGDRVIATARSLEKLQDLFAPIDPLLRDNLRTLQLDVTDGEAVLKAKACEAFSIWGQIDVLVNNAGVGLPSLLEEGGAAHLRRQFDTNVFSVIDLTAAMLPHLRASKEAAILVVGSRSAWKTEIPGIALTETLAVEVAPFNIRVLLIAPGSFRTEGIYGQLYNTSNAVPVNDALREASMSKFKSIPGTEKGDPCKAMEAVVDIVRGEGVAAGRPWPGLLILGEDAERDVRDKSVKVLKALDEWKDVTFSSDVAPLVREVSTGGIDVLAHLTSPGDCASSEAHCKRTQHLWRLPTVGYDGAIMSYFSALRFVRHGEDVLREGSEMYMDRALKIPLLDRWFVVVNGERLFETLRNGRDDALSSWEATREAKPARFLPSIRDEAGHAFEAHIKHKLGGRQEWTPIVVQEPFTKIVCQIGNRVFVGFPLSSNAASRGTQGRNEEYCKLNIRFSANAIAAAGVINLFPRVLKPLVGTLYNKLSGHQAMMHRILGPEIEDRKRKIEDGGVDYAGKPNDMLTWVLESATPGFEQETSSLALRILNLNFMLIHSTYVSFTHIVYNLAAQPKYLDILREENRMHLDVTTKQWSLEDLEKCVILDSFLKESLRSNGLGAISLPHKALVPFTLVDGTDIPVGTIVTATSTSAHLNTAHYDDPNIFDGLRFVKMREKMTPLDSNEDQDAKYCLTSAGPGFLTFGGGKHIWYARLFEDIVQTLLAF